MADKLIRTHHKEEWPQRSQERQEGYRKLKVYRLAVRRYLR